MLAFREANAGFTVMDGHSWDVNLIMEKKILIWFGKVLVDAILLYESLVVL